MTGPAFVPVQEKTLARMIAAAGLTYGRHRKLISRAVYIATALVLIGRLRSAIVSNKRPKGSKTKPDGTVADSNTANPDQVGPNKAFLRSLSRLIAIVVPGWTSKEMRLLVSHSILLVVRTGLSLYVADLDGRLVSRLVQGRGRAFIAGLAWWMAVAVPATFTNAMLSYHQCQLAVLFRARLTNHIQTRYLAGNAFYGLVGLDDRIENVDQVIAVDVARFSTSLAELYSNLAKPVLDMAVYTAALSRSIGGEALFGMMLLVQLSAGLMRALTPPFGKYVAEEARLEGEFRFQHGRLIDYSEEIAFLNGHEAEKDTLDKGYFTLIKHVNRMLRRRFYHGFLEDFVVKYLWGALGLVLCSVPVFFQMPGTASAALLSSVGGRTESFIRNRRLLLSASDAFGRIMFSYKEISELAGHTSRVSSLLDVLDDVTEGRFQKRRAITKTESGSSESSVTSPNPLLSSRGTVVEGTDIEFDGVPIVSPTGEVLIPAISFSVRRGGHLLVVGPNGCGKSSLFRILGGLWPVYAGKVTKPAVDQIFYVPQRPYLARGSLRTQIIYPDSRAMMAAKGKSDDDLTAILELVQIDSLVRSEDGRGWDTEAEWGDVLSVGLQQRVAMARLFYHSPAFAILDECTSSVTAEMERRMYDHARAVGITLMTVSHRRSLWQYHDHILQFDGKGGYVFAPLDPVARLRLEDERDEIESRLRAVPELKRRLAELERATVPV